jgi:hypothetical protein
MKGTKRAHEKNPTEKLAFFLPININYTWTFDLMIYIYIYPQLTRIARNDILQIA